MNNDHLFKLVDPDLAIWTIRAFYIFAGYAILVVRLIPDFRHRFLEYGARSDKSKQKSSHQSALPQWFRIQVDPVLDLLANITVPHGWFTHFYVCSTVCSAYWLVCSKNLFHCYHAGFRQNMFGSWEYRTLICMVLLQVQGLRRLYECVVIAKSSKSRMWIGHYFIGVAFYLVTNVAIWIEPGKHLCPNCIDASISSCKFITYMMNLQFWRAIPRIAICITRYGNLIIYEISFVWLYVSQCSSTIRGNNFRCTSTWRVSKNIECQTTPFISIPTLYALTTHSRSTSTCVLPSSLRERRES